MSKYQPLSDHLAGLAAETWEASFADLERVLGFSLPQAARNGGAWWANVADKSHNRAWLDAGWEVSEVDRKGERVHFRRTSGPAATVYQAQPTLSVARTAGMAAAVGGVAALLGFGFSALRRRRRA